MKNVLIVMTSMHNGGAERSLANFLNELPEDKYLVDLLLFKREGTFLEQIPQYVNLLDTPPDLYSLFGPLHKAGKNLGTKIIGNVVSRMLTRNSCEKRGFRWIHFYEKKLRKIEKNYDVAIAYISEEVLWYIDEKVNADRKIVWVHNDYRSAQYQKKYDYQHFRHMDAIVTISDTCAKILREEFPDLGDRIVVLENITSSLIVRKRAKEYNPPEIMDTTFNILSVGRLNQAKGFDLAVEAAGILKKRGYHFRWNIIGNGELKKALLKQIKKNGVEDCVFLLGIKENPYPYFSHSQILVQSSIYEGKSVVLDEAKILGLPMVVTNYPTVRDQLLDGKEGIIVPVSAEGIASGIERMMTKADELNGIRDYLRKKEYGNQNTIVRYTELIDN